MTIALAVLLAFIAIVALFDLVAVASGADSRDGFVDDHHR